MSNLRIFPATDLHLLDNTGVDLKFFAAVPAWSDLSTSSHGTTLARRVLSWGGAAQKPGRGQQQRSSPRQRLPPTRCALQLQVVFTGDEKPIFVDTVTGRAMTRAEFVDAIHAGGYPDYLVRNINGVLTPASRPNATSADNLG